MEGINTNRDFKDTDGFEKIHLKLEGHLSFPQPLPPPPSALSPQTHQACKDAHFHDCGMQGTADLMMMSGRWAFLQEVL